MRAHDPNAAAALFVRRVDPAAGAAGFVPIAPAVLPGSPLRFARGRPLAPARGVPLHTISPGGGPGESLASDVPAVPHRPREAGR